MSFATYPSLSGKSVFVTGGASGIGADIVKAFHGQGANVGFVDILDEAAKKLNADCGGALTYHHCDITDIPALQTAIAEISAEIGPITVLVNNAANDKRELVDEITVDDWNRAQDINLRPQFFAAQAVRSGMTEAGGGAIINFSSIAWRAGAAEMSPYVTAKAGVIGMTKSLASAFGGDNIRVNAIEPGAVITERQRELWFKTEASVEAMVDRQALKSVLEGAEIARAVLFLASDDACMITKQTLVIDAGIL
jgi:NAD(P)-dependent dehydrogenase (short-subunit alcohol dehydrogenase family)